MTEDSEKQNFNEKTQSPIQNDDLSQLVQKDESTCDICQEENSLNQCPSTDNTHDKRQKAIEYTKRVVFLLVGLIIMAFGVAFSINAQLDTSPVSSIPYVTSITSGLSVGATTIIVNTIIVLLQIPIMRKKFKLIRLLQIPVCTVFGLMIDLASLCIADIMPQQYYAKWILCIVGIVLVAVGVSFEMTANVITLAGEGLVQAVCSVCPIKFGYMKVICDVSFVVIAVAISFIFLHNLQGVREGTLAAAIFVGLLAKQLNKIIQPLGNKFFNVKKANTTIKD